MGLIQSALIPETGGLFCKGPEDALTNYPAREKAEIRVSAALYKLKSGDDFYRLS